MYRAGCGIFIDAFRRCKQSAYVIHITLAGSGNNRSAVDHLEFGKSDNIRRERSHLFSASTTTR